MKDSFGKEISRRGFTARVGQDFMAANVARTFFKKAAVNEVTTPDSPGKKLGERSYRIRLLPEVTTPMRCRG